MDYDSNEVGTDSKFTDPDKLLRGKLSESQVYPNERALQALERFKARYGNHLKLPLDEGGLIVFPYPLDNGQSKE